jgi:E3 ubiquitin-protein ligase RGLG
MGRTLEVFDDDKLIPAFGFGDATTGSAKCFNMGHDGSPCRGFSEILRRYCELTPTLTLSGPTNFAPVIRETINIVKTTLAYHILLIIADGQVTNEKETADAIVDASNYPICTYHYEMRRFEYIHADAPAFY